MCFAFYHIPTTAVPAVSVGLEYPFAGPTSSSDVALFCDKWQQSQSLKGLMAEGNLTTLRDYVSIKLMCMGGADMGLHMPDSFKLRDLFSHQNMSPPSFTPQSPHHNASNWERNSTHCYMNSSRTGSIHIRPRHAIHHGSYESFIDAIHRFRTMDDSTLVGIMRQSFGKFREALPVMPEMSDLGEFSDLETFMQEMNDYMKNLKMDMNLKGLSLKSNVQAELQHLSGDMNAYMQTMTQYTEDMTAKSMEDMQRMKQELQKRLLDLNLNLTQIYLEKMAPHLPDLPEMPEMPVHIPEMPEMNQVKDAVKLMSEMWAESAPQLLYSLHENENYNDNVPAHAQQLERWPIIVFLITAVVCMVFSSLFHLLYVKSLDVYNVMVRLDYSGIALLIAGSYFPWLYYGFYCNAVWQMVYLTTIVLLGSATFLVSLLEFFSDPKYNLLRMIIFLSFGAFCIVPNIHLLYLNSWDIFSDGITCFLPTQALEVAVYFAGAMVFLFRLPERWTKGATDLVGSSHQIWHVFVVLGAALHFKMCLEQYDYRQQNMCIDNYDGKTGLGGMSVGGGENISMSEHS